MFSDQKTPPVYVSRSDANNPLASYSKHSFELDGAHWPSVEHYYQATKFEDLRLREAIREVPHPKDAQQLAKKNKRRIREDWVAQRQVVMTRGVYIKCRTHAEVAQALLATGEAMIVETSQYDYFWGCGRDLRGENAYGKVLMRVRERLRQEARQNTRVE